MIKTLFKNEKPRNIVVKTILLLMVTIVVFSACYFLFSQKDVSARLVFANAEVIQTEIKENYNVGEEITAPEQAQVKYNEELFNGKFYAIKGGDGKIYSSKSIKLTTTGVYSVIYEFTPNGKKMKACCDFNVIEKTYSVVSETSKVVFGQLEMGEKNKGYTISISDGDTFTYNVPINLSENNLTDVIKFYPNQTPLKFAQRAQKLNGVNFDAEYIIVTLTDLYNPSVYVKAMLYYAPTYGNGIFARTSASGQGEFGLYLDCPIVTQPKVYIDDRMYGLYEGKFGQAITSTGTVPDYYVWSFDYAENRVYLTEGENKKYLINDLDSDIISKNKFNGFTTGEVIVSVTANSNYASSTTVQIEAIGNINGENLRSLGYEDKTSPLIVVEGVEKPIYVKKGENVKIANSVTYDASQTESVKVNVYQNYGTSMQGVVAIKNGEFKANTVGTYVVEYSARDSFGNVGKTQRYVLCVDEEVTAITVNKATQLLTGVKSPALSYTTSSYNGEVDVKIKAVARDGKEYEINNDDCSFTPLSAGNYTIQYKYSDCVKEYEYSYVVNCLENNENVFIDTPTLLKYYIKNSVCEVPKLTAYSFKDGTQKTANSEVYVKFDDGEYVKLTNDTFTVSGSSTIQFKYVSQSAEYVTEKANIIDVGFDNELRVEDYFVGDFDAVKNFDSIDFNLNSKSGSSSIEFVNIVSPNMFSMEYKFLSTNFKSFSFVLTDLENVKNKLTVKYQTVNGGLTVFINDGKGNIIHGLMDDGVKRYIKYVAKNKAFYFGDNAETTMVPFVFDMNYCSLEMQFEDISGDAGIRIYNLQNQIINDTTYDDYEPQIFCKESSGYAEINTKATAYEAYAFDVLSTCLSGDLILSVTNPKGEYVIDENGVMLRQVIADRDYSFTLEQYGLYFVEYTVRDGSGKNSIQYYTINVADMIEPTVSFTDGATAQTVDEVKVKRIYNVKDYVVNDNYSQKDKLITIVYIYNENSILMFMGKDEVTFLETGLYTVYVRCVDEAGNYNMASYKVNVVGEK